jgi:hypothetical protein
MFHPRPQRDSRRGLTQVGRWPRTVFSATIASRTGVPPLTASGLMAGSSRRCQVMSWCPGSQARTFPDADAAE